MPGLDRRVDELERRYEELFHRRPFYPTLRAIPALEHARLCRLASTDEASQIQDLDNEIYKLEQEAPHVEERRFQVHWLEGEIRTR